MKIVAIRDALVPIGAPIANASITFDRMTASAVAITTDLFVDGAPVIGYAFDSIGRYGKSGLLRERFIPRLLAAEPDALRDASGLIDPVAAWRVLMTNEKAGGHGERPGAVALLEAALWDARAKAERLPLWRALANRYGTRDASPRIAVYASCGHFRPGEPLDALAGEVARAVSLGYRTVKIKAGGARIADDLARIAAAHAALGGRGSLAVDLNGMLDPAIAADWFAAAGDRRLAWVEEPASPLDYLRLAEYAAASRIPIATGENLFSFDDARNLARHGGLREDRDLVQVDMLLAYGVTEYMRILECFEQAGWSRARFVPHAGHLFAAQCVAGLGLGSAEAAPDPSLVYGGFWDGTAVDDGQLVVPGHPGVGFEAKTNLYELLAPLGG